MYLLIITHITLWTLAPTLLRHTLPMDSLEGFVWGQTWQLGYDRNPWMNAWLTHIAVELGGKSGWLVYLFSQSSVALCFLSVWHLGKKFLPPSSALIAVFLLEGVQYYHLAAVDFNDNVLELGLWAALTLFFYNALAKQNLRSWLLTGALAALSLMTKYYAIAIFIPMGLILLFTAEGHLSFKKTGIYWGILLFLFMVLPHFIWLFHHDFITLNYAISRSNSGSGFQNSPWYFAIIQILSFAAPSLLFFSLIWSRKTAKNNHNNHINHTNHNDHQSHKNNLDTHSLICCNYTVNNFTKTFLLALGMGPYLATVILSLIFNISLHTMWGTPLLSFWGLLLITFIQPNITQAKFYRFVAATFILLFGIVSVYSYNLAYTGYASSATFPGKTIAEYINKEWSNRYPQHSLPSFVIGNRYAAGNVAFFATTKQHKPKACTWDEKIYVCVSDEEIYRKGAVFVWQVGDKEYQKAENLSFINKIKKRFPNTVFLKDKSFKWIYHPKGPSLYMGIALLPPRQHSAIIQNSAIKK